MVTDDQKRPGAEIQRQDARSYAVRGAMTFDSVNDLWRQSVELFSGETVLQVDLAQVTGTDSAGLALLVEWLREAPRRGARIRFLHLPAQMLALADAANLEQLLVEKHGSATS